MSKPATGARRAPHPDPKPSENTRSKEGPLPMPPTWSLTSGQHWYLTWEPCSLHVDLGFQLWWEGLWDGVTALQRSDGGPIRGRRPVDDRDGDALTLDNGVEARTLIKGRSAIRRMTPPLQDRFRPLTCCPSPSKPLFRVCLRAPQPCRKSKKSTRTMRKGCQDLITSLSMSTTRVIRRSSTADDLKWSRRWARRKRKANKGSWSDGGQESWSLSGRPLNGDFQLPEAKRQFNDFVVLAEAWGHPGIVRAGATEQERQGEAGKPQGQRWPETGKVQTGQIQDRQGRSPGTTKPSPNREQASRSPSRLNTDLGTAKSRKVWPDGLGSNCYPPQSYYSSAWAAEESVTCLKSIYVYI